MGSFLRGGALACALVAMAAGARADEPAPDPHQVSAAERVTWAPGRYDPDRCRTSEACRETGRCVSAWGTCVAASPQDCTESTRCRTLSRCYFDPELFVCGDDHVHSEGYRLLWYRSTRKAEQDKSRRARAIQKATEALSDLRGRLQGPRTRFRVRSKVEQALAEVLAETEASSWLLVEIEEQEEETFRQATRGRPSEQTKYLRETRPRFTLTWKLNVEALSEAEREDGVFPLLTNDRKLSATEVLRAYKRQPLLEKRFSQFKTDFAAAPVFLKNVSRIQSLLAA
jgi:hypothetical protein